MPSDTDLRITATVVIPLAELRFQFSRSSGPGGQHVNRTESQVELTFDVAHSPSLSDAQRARLLTALPSYIDTHGILHLASQTTRSQHRNRADVMERFQALVQRALYIPKRRRPTRPSVRAVERRLESKHRTSTAKQERRSRWPTSE